jgi:hypothetical protein
MCETLHLLTINECTGAVIWQSAGRNREAMVHTLQGQSCPPVRCSSVGQLAPVRVTLNCKPASGAPA